MTKSSACLILCFLLMPAVPSSAAEPLFRLDLAGADAALGSRLALTDGGGPFRRPRGADEAAVLGSILAGPSRISVHDGGEEPGGRGPAPPIVVVSVARPLDRGAAERAGWGLFKTGGLFFLYDPHDAERARRYALGEASTRPAPPPPGCFAAGRLSLEPLGRLFALAAGELEGEVKRIEPPCLLRLRAEDAALAAAGERTRPLLLKRFEATACPEGGGRYEFLAASPAPRRRCPRHGTADAYDPKGFDPAAFFAEARDEIAELAAHLGFLGPLSFEARAREGAIDAEIRLALDFPGMRKRLFLRGGPGWLARLIAPGPGLDPKVAGAIPAEAESFVALRLPALPRAVAEAAERSLARGIPERRDDRLAVAARYLSGLSGLDFPDGPLADLAPGFAWFSLPDATGGDGVFVGRIADPNRVGGWRTTVSALAAAFACGTAETCGYSYHRAPSESPAGLPVAEFGLLDDLLVVSPGPGGVALAARVLAGEEEPLPPPPPGVSLRFRLADAGPLLADLSGGTFAAWDAPLTGEAGRDGDALRFRLRLAEGGEAR